MSARAAATLGVFAKFWTPGQVKTRLAKALGHRRAAEIHRLFVIATLERHADFPGERVLAYSPAEHHHDFVAVAPFGWRMACQKEGNLGRRLAGFIDDEIQSGAAEVLILGSDSPDVPREIIPRALRLLAQHGVVLGPCHDGGYYLVAVRAEEWLGRGALRKAMFDGIPWSTKDVLRATVERLRHAGFPCAFLQPWYDVDHVDDLLLLRSRILGCRTDSSLARLADALEDLLGNCHGRR